MKDTIESIDKKIQELEDKKRVILAEKERINNKVISIKVKLSIGTYEVEKKIHHKGKTYAECEKDCPKGWEIATYQILQELRNTKQEEFNLNDTWEFVQQIDKISKKKGYVARFCAGSVRVDLGAYCGSDFSDSALGVRYVRKIREKR